MILQGIFAGLNITVAAVVPYLILRILRPIFDLTSATSQVSKGNLDVTVKSKGSDELSILTKSFNSMVKSLKSYISKQNELTKQLEDANEQLKYRDKLKDEFINVADHELRTPIQPILGLTSPPSDIPTFVIDTSRTTCTREVIAIDILRITCNGPMPTTWDFAGEASDLRCTGLAAIPNSVFACNMRFVNGFGIGGPDLPCFIGQQEITCLKPF